MSTIPLCSDALQFTARYCMVGYCYVLSDFSSLLHRDVDVSRIMALADLEVTSHRPRASAFPLLLPLLKLS